MFKDRILSKDISAHEGKDIKVSGWVHRIRDLGAINFVILRDRSGFVQLVYDTKVEFNQETVILAEGKVQKNEKALGRFEIQIKNTTVLAKAAPDLPLPINQDPSHIGLDSILDNRMVSIRNPKIRSIFHLQASIIKYFQTYLNSEGFTEIKTSKLIGTGTEGGTGLFEVNYFDTSVFLAQSPQFYKQAMVASGMEKVYEVGAAYRAEKHDTPRHLNEYVSLDVEMGFIENEHDLMDLEVGILTSVFEGVQQDHADILEQYDATVPSAEELKKIPRLSHEDAKKIVSDKLGRRIFEINPEAERVICQWALENHGIEAVFILGWPRKKRPFYTFPEGLKTRSFDLIFRGLEITTGGQRINEYSMLKEALPRFGLTEQGLGSYVDIFKYGCPPHGGFAIGLERLTQKILGIANVKEASLFPRDRKRIAP